VSDYEVGMKTRREVLGDEHVDRAAANAGTFGAPWQEFITRYAWGGPWSRPGLDRRMRSAITLAALVSLRAENEIGMHVRAALGNGLTAEEIGEIFIHTAVYAGVPASNAAFAIARKVLEEEGALPPALPPALPSAID
jgi:4-carboxymuconolactone decarboxylase